MRAILLHNYRPTEATNVSGTPPPHFIFLLVESMSWNEDKSAYTIPLPSAKPIIFDLGFTRFSIVLQLKAEEYIANEADRGTFVLTNGGVTRTYKEYSYGELREVFSVMQYQEDSPGHNWELLEVSLSNSILHTNIPPIQTVKTYPVAVSNVSSRYDTPAIYSDITVNLLSSGEISTPFDIVQ